MEQIRSETLRTSSYFLELTDAELEWLRRNADLLHKPKDSVILLEGAESPGLLVILSGSVKVCRIASSGREQVLRVANAGDSLNDVPVFDGGTCPATVVALEESDVLVVPAPVFRELLSRHSSMAVQLLQTFALRLRQITRLAADLTLLNVNGRVAKALDVYTRTAGSDQFTLNQSELASIVGARREVVARSLKQLEDDVVIERHHDFITVIDREKLAESFDSDSE